MSRRNFISTLSIAVTAVAGVVFGLGLGPILFALQTDSPTDAKSQTDRMIVHEWGTFTELQNESGISLTGINTDDEPVPDFVHGFGGQVLTPTVFPEQMLSKRIPQRHWQVAMRLETPVIYFYPPDGAELPVKLDVEVRLRDGWLSEYYPDAEMSAPGIDQLTIRNGEYSTLTWRNLLVGTEDRYPETQDGVWLNPRATQSAGLTNEQGESEKYLFYRGVGKFSGPLQVSMDRDAGEISLHATSESNNNLSPVGIAWLVHVTSDGNVAFKRIQPDNKAGSITGQSTGYRFSDEEYTNTIARLKDQMHSALVADGLFADEANAMLATWNRAYFMSPGLRVFYLVPQAWTDDQMPMHVSVDSLVERVMMGRVELISDENAETIQKIKSNPVASANWMSKVTNAIAFSRMLAGHSDFGELGVEIPADYRMYLDLGRFRNAMLRAEQLARPDKNLFQFLNQYGLNPPAMLELPVDGS